MVNIIIPIYHSRKTLPDVLGSLVIQTYKDFKVTLVQDCDGENYDDLIEKYSQDGLKIQLISLLENVGPGLARQVALDEDTTSDYIMLCDSDDMVLPQAIEALVRGISTNNLDIVSSSFMRHYPDRNIIQDVKNTAITWCAGKIYRNSYLKENNIRFHPQLRLNEDSYFNVVAWNSTAKRGQLSEVTVLMMDNPESLTRKDGQRGFFKNGWEQYILSQVDGMREIFRQTTALAPAVAARTLVYLYQECMMALFQDFDVSKAQEYLKKLNVGWFKDLMKYKDFWEELDRSSSGVMFFDGEIFFPKINIEQWFSWFFSKEDIDESAAARKN